MSDKNQVNTPEGVEVSAAAPSLSNITNQLSQPLMDAANTFMQNLSHEDMLAVVGITQGKDIASNAGKALDNLFAQEL